jgi:hypothetical protein
MMEKKKEKNVENQVKHNRMKDFLKEYRNFLSAFSQDFLKILLMYLHNFEN